MSERTALCAWCFQKKMLIKAHIVPRSFFAAVAQNEKYTVLIRTASAKKTKSLQAGIYDRTILCADCDNRFSQLDKYGWLILSKPIANVINDPRAPVKLAVEIRGVDTDRLRRFVLSVLWRSSVSTLDVYSKVNLGPKFQGLIKSRIFDPNPLDYDEYSTCFVAIEDSSYEGLSKVMFSPFRARLDGINWQIIYFPGVKVLVKVDSRPTAGSFISLMVSQEDRFYIAKPTKGLVPELNYIARLRFDLMKKQKTVYN